MTHVEDFFFSFENPSDGCANHYKVEINDKRLSGHKASLYKINVLPGEAGGIKDATGLSLLFNL